MEPMLIVMEPRVSRATRRCRTFSWYHVLISCPLLHWEHWAQGLETQVRVPVTLGKLLHFPGFLNLGYGVSKTPPSHDVCWKKLSLNSDAYRVLEAREFDDVNGRLWQEMEMKFYPLDSLFPKMSPSRCFGGERREQGTCAHV